MNETINAEMVLLVDAAGDYAVGVDEDGARADYLERIGNLEETDGFRLVRIKVKVPLPAIPELTGEVPAQGDAALLAVA